MMAYKFTWIISQSTLCIHFVPNMINCIVLKIRNHMLWCNRQLEYAVESVDLMVVLTEISARAHTQRLNWRSMSIFNGRMWTHSAICSLGNIFANTGFFMPKHWCMRSTVGMTHVTDKQSDTHSNSSTLARDNIITSCFYSQTLAPTIVFLYCYQCSMACLFWDIGSLPICRGSYHPLRQHTSNI